MLAAANALFGGGPRRRGDARRAPPAAAAAAAAAPAAAPSAQQLQLDKLGCVAGLSALLLSYPYDVPSWLPPVLMALVRGSGAGEADGTVRAAAGRALAEFRRTHEAEALEELRALMDADDWDSFTHATGTASYFV
ncbi:hypothetical protein TSOC_001759 [Tetrabaena socialis]|uniref:Proteasome activator complex subunit 4 C-terminal domain-containing protein n=1 Tax=Tetrabaena socialis TaxID=47790 RepID=A0A2J8AFS0_9CHLO|nr:hypothetical protein TSOC_001759 [Tetrabaena socialis]|eukprot:PNH11368.1 hypothetical protein TSOC_001759 [Tetrabaena socialis]